jgi:transcriptional regulator with XRE-family HTH domain
MRGALTALRTACIKSGMMSRTKRLRESKGWSQPQMAERLGVAQSTVSRLETGELGDSGPVAKLLDLLERRTRGPSQRRPRRPQQRRPTRRSDSGNRSD